MTAVEERTVLRFPLPHKPTTLIDAAVLNFPKESSK